jgi:hypothetical protein
MPPPFGLEATFHEYEVEGFSVNAIEGVDE